mmetsp:Transcript_46918/g.149802  ORF Transcript_46918/g.149802 Transcript_46918/m.149802 type:complete len:185 (+) Transcript_46918:193-747(+)
MSVEEDCTAEWSRERTEGSMDLGTLTAESPSSLDTGVVVEGTAVGTGISVGEDETGRADSISTAPMAADCGAEGPRGGTAVGTSSLLSSRTYSGGAAPGGTAVGTVGGVAVAVAASVGTMVGTGTSAASPVAGEVGDGTSVGTGMSVGEEGARAEPTCSAEIMPAEYAPECIAGGPPSAAGPPL